MKVAEIGRRRGIGTSDDGRGCPLVKRVGAGMRGAANISESVYSLLCLAGVDSGMLMSVDDRVSCRIESSDFSFLWRQHHGSSLAFYAELLQFLVRMQLVAWLLVAHSELVERLQHQLM